MAAEIKPYLPSPMRHGQWVDMGAMDMFCDRMRKGDTELEALDYINAQFKSKIRANQLEITKRRNPDFARAIISAIHEDLGPVLGRLRGRMEKGDVKDADLIRYAQLQYSRMEREKDRIAKYEQIDMTANVINVDPFEQAASAQRQMGYALIDGEEAEAEPHPRTPETHGETLAGPPHPEAFEPAGGEHGSSNGADPDECGDGDPEEESWF